MVLMPEDRLREQALRAGLQLEFVFDGSDHLVAIWDGRAQLTPLLTINEATLWLNGCEYGCASAGVSPRTGVCKECGGELCL